MLRVAAFAAVFAAAAEAVTLETSTPTEGSNYMVMQGDFEYMVGGVNMGAVSGRAQLVRSAVDALSTFSFSVKIETFVEGDELEAVVRRKQCSYADVLPYQDPYACPGFNPVSQTNPCPEQIVGDSNPVEVRMLCTVDATGKCEASFAWPIYIPEDYEGQLLSDLSLALFPADSDDSFVCADLTDVRETTATEAVAIADAGGAEGEITVGRLEKDELGYTRVSFLAQGLTAGFTYGAHVADGDCDPRFSAPAAVAELSFTFTTDGLGIAADVSHAISSIAGPETAALVVTDCLNGSGDPDPTGTCAGGAPAIMCYNFEMTAAPVGRSGAVDSNSEETGDSKSGVVARVSDDDASVSSCSAWSHLYQDSGGKGKGKKGGKHGFGQFVDKQIDGMTRCCVAHKYEIGKNKEGKRYTVGSLHASAPATAGDGSVFVGVGAGVAGAVVLAVGVMLHVRRTRRAALSPEYAEVTENTPLTSKVTLLKESSIDGVAIIPAPPIADHRAAEASK